MLISIRENSDHPQEVLLAYSVACLCLCEFDSFRVYGAWRFGVVRDGTGGFGTFSPNFAIRTLRTIQTRAVLVEWRYVGYESITYHTNYITYHPVPSVQNVPEQSENGQSGIKIAGSAIPRLTLNTRLFLDAFSDYNEKWHTS